MHSKDVYQVFDRFTRPQKLKRAICVCPKMMLFLRINSEPLWKPNHLICAVNCDFIDHDSYVELKSLLKYSHDDLGDGKRLGRLTPPIAKGIMDAVEAAGTLSQAHKDLVRDRWGF